MKINLVGATVSEVEVTIDNAKMPSGLLVAERPTDPGTHVVTVTRGGKVAAETVTTLAEAEKKVVTLQVPAAGNAVVPAAAPAAPATAQAPGVGFSVPPAAPAGPVNAHVMQPATSPPPQLPPQGTGTQSTGGTSTESSSVATRRTMGWIGIGVGAAGVALGTTGGIIAAVTRSQLHRDGCIDNTCVGSGFNSPVDAYNSWRNISAVSIVVGGVSAAAGLTLLLTSPTQESAPKVGLLMAPGTVSLKGAF